MKNSTGSPVEGDDFFGREKELDFAWKHIEEGNSLIFPAPRRIGKTSFAKKLLEKAKANGWRTLEINLEESKDEVAFISNLLEKMENTEGWFSKKLSQGGKVAKKILESIKPKLKYGGVEGSIEWKSEEIDVYKALEKLFGHEQETLIFIDELTILLNNYIENDAQNGKAKVRFVLDWMRSQRLISGTKIRWIFCSSIGIENFTNRHGISYSFNDVAELKLKPFSREEATGLLEAIIQTKQMNVPSEVSEVLLDKIQWYIPYFVQILFFEYHQKIEIDEMSHSLETLEKAYESLLYSKHFNTWDERLKEYGDLEKSARVVLKHLCKIKEGERKENLLPLIHHLNDDIDDSENILSRVLNMLRNDGYLVEDEAIHRFRSPLLRDFWYKRFIIS